jgi:hypothetical protein
VFNPQRPLSSSPPEEDQAQLGQRLAKPKRDGEVRKSQALGDGKTSDLGSQRLFLSEAPNEDMVQADKNTTESSESRHPLQVPLIPSSFNSVSVAFSDAAKRGAGITVPSAELPEAPEAPEARNARIA